MSQRLESSLNETADEAERAKWSSQKLSISFEGSAAALLLRANPPGDGVRNPSGGGVRLAAGLQGQVVVDGLGVTSSAGVWVSLAF